MQCREFREIADSYLSDELLVETNHQVFRHMENCPDCRAEFAGRRELRKKFKSAFIKAEEFKIDQAFVDHLPTKLKEDYFHKSKWQTMLSIRIMIPAMTGLLILFIVSFAFISKNFNDLTRGAISQNSQFKTLFAGVLQKAVGDHKECALDHLKFWETETEKEPPEKAIYNKQVVKPLEAKLEDKIEFIHVHDCTFEGKIFTHVILRKNEHILSVIIDKSGDIPALVETLGDSIMLEKDDNLQIAAFQNNNRTVFIISDLPEAQNLLVARTLSDSWKQTL